MAVANDRYERPESLTRLQQQEVDQTATLSVLSVAPSGDKAARCGDCGAGGLIFHCHCLNEASRPIRDLCRSCIIDRAGGEETIWLKTTCRGLREMWETGRRKSQPDQLRKARSHP